MGGVSGPVHMSNIGGGYLKSHFINYIDIFTEKKNDSIFDKPCLQASQKIDMQAEVEKEIEEQNGNISVQF